MDRRHRGLLAIVIVALVTCLAIAVVLTLRIDKYPQYDHVADDRAQELVLLARTSVVERDGARVEGAYEDGRTQIVITGDVHSTLFSVEAPDDYRFEDCRWSADGDWIFCRDTRGHLLAVPADGSADPRIIADDRASAYWDESGGVGP